MQVTRNSGLARYEWRGTYAERMVPRDHGWRWDKARKVWWTDSLDRVRPLAEHGDERTQRAVAKADVRVLRSYATELNDPSSWREEIESFGAERGLSLYPYQMAGVDYALRYRRVIIGDDMGLGKTMQAIAAAEISGADRVVVCCPKAVATNWRERVAEWTGRVPWVVQGQASEHVEQGKWAILPYPISHHRWTELSCDFLIIDESHFLKEPDRKRTTAILGGFDKRQKCKIPGLVDSTRWVLALTGTPIPNRPKELQPVLTGGMRQRWAYGLAYLERYCGPHQVWTGREYVTKYDGSCNEEELSRKLREGCMIRRTKKEVFSQLPEKVRTRVDLNLDEYEGPALSPEQAQAIVAALELGELPSFEFMSEIRREQAIAKVPLAAEFIRQTIDEPVVIYCHHKDVAMMLALELDGGALYTGDTPTRRRDQIVRDFSSGGFDMLIGTIGALGTGVDGLQRHARIAIFVELDWVPGNLDQAEDRLCRIGQDATVLVYHLIVPGTIDSYMYRTITAKQRTIAKVLA